MARWSTSRRRDRSGAADPTTTRSVREHETARSSSQHRLARAGGRAARRAARRSASTSTAGSDGEHAEQRHREVDDGDEPEVAQHRDVGAAPAPRSRRSRSRPRRARRRRSSGRCARSASARLEPGRALLAVARATSSTANSVEIAITSAPSVADIGFSGTPQQRTARAPTSRWRARSARAAPSARSQRAVARRAARAPTASRPASSVAEPPQRRATARALASAASTGRPAEPRASRPAAGRSRARMSSITCCWRSSGISRIAEREVRRPAVAR